MAKLTGAFHHFANAPKQRDGIFPNVERAVQINEAYRPIRLDWYIFTPRELFSKRTYRIAGPSGRAI